MMEPEDWVRSDTLVPALILAPPGCGKTELLAQRAAFCVKERLLPAHRRVLALTFTHKARDNITSRLKEQLGPASRSHVTVVNFHGLGYSLLRHHRYVLADEGLPELLPDDRALRRIQRDVFSAYNVPRNAQQDLLSAVRVAKAGPFSDEQVLSTLEDLGSPATVAYQKKLQDENRMDHDDVLRLGLRILANDDVARLYSERFAYVLVDEAQDLTRTQYGLIRRLGEGCSVFAGDRTQGIYGFAGADPDWVFDQIEAVNPVRVRLTRSYRSSPEVLAVVNALATQLGGPELTSAEPEKWDGRGRASLARFDGQAEEAAWLLKQIQSWHEQAQAEDPPREISVGVLTRMKPGGRRDALIRMANDAGVAIETWDHPLHRPDVVRLLRKHVAAVTATTEDPADQVEALYLRCVAEVPADQASTLIELREAIDELSDLVETSDLASLVSTIRVSSGADVPVGTGTHLLTGHSGKGQGFDKVVILGFEEGQLPSFFVKHLPDDHPEVREELALCHVMASRAREELLITLCANTNGYLQRPSRWMKLVAPVIELRTDS